jgi:hypothetical protein
MKKLHLLLQRLVYCFAYNFDYVIGYVMTNPHKLPLYHCYMYEKYGDKYCSKEEFDEYWNSIPEEPSSGYVNQD